MPDRGGLPTRLRVILAALLSALLIGVYVWLPTTSSEQQVPSDPEDGPAAGRVDIVNVSPTQPYPGELLIVDYVNTSTPVERVYVGKRQIPIVSQRLGTVVVRVPKDAAPGRLKIRVGREGERSKPFDVRVEARDWRVPFRDFFAGFALIVFGIGMFARGTRESVGRAGADRLGRYGRSRLVAFGFGTVAGALSQSTVASAALLSGLSASSLVTSVTAAVAFLGAQVGAGTLPLATGLVDPRVGLIGVALGVLWLGLAESRQTSAYARLALGAGFIVFGLHLLRSGIEPLVVDEALLQLTAGLQADTLSGKLLCVALGCMLVAILQGAASASLVAVGLLQVVGQLDLRVLMFVLAGSGLGAAVGALLATRTDERGRRLTELHLLLGLASSILAFFSVDLWVALARAIAPTSDPLASFAGNPLAPAVGGQLVAAVVLSQLGVALCVMPLAPLLGKWLKRVGQPTLDETHAIGNEVERARRGLSTVLQIQGTGLRFVSELVLAGERSAGRVAEHRLADARSGLESLLAGVVRALPSEAQGEDLRHAAFACLQLERSLEDLLYRAERFVDRQVAMAARGEGVPDISALQKTTREMHELLVQALDAAQAALGNEQRVNLEAARARELRLNALEAQSRRAALEASGDNRSIQVRLDLLELFDAYEGAGNHLYRLAEALSGAVLPHRAVSA